MSGERATRGGHRGLEIRCRRHAVSPSVAVRIWLLGGQLREASPGLGLACGRLLTEGTERRTWDQIIDLTERRGMDIGGIGGPELIGLSVDALAEDWREALELACELILEAAFPEERCAWMRRRVGAELESLAEQPEVRTAWAFMDQVYSPHPWGRPLHGDEAGLVAIESLTCAAFHRGSLDRGVIASVAGDVSEDAARELLGRRLSCLDRRPGEGTDAAEAPLPSPPAPVADERRIELPESDQAQVFIGHLTVPVAHPDFLALELASVVLGSGPGLVGRIPERVRERDGLAYAASVALTSGAGSAPGRLVVHAGTAPDRVPRLIAAVREELERLLDEGIDADELEEARRYVLGSDPFRRETARQLASQQAQAVLFGVPLDDAEWLASSLRELEPGAVEAALRRHVHPDRLSVTIGVPRSR